MRRHSPELDGESRAARSARRVKVALFGTGSPLSVAALEALAPEANVVGVVLPLPRASVPLVGMWQAARVRTRQRPFAESAQRLGIPILSMLPRGDAELAAALGASAPDLICVASFPYVLREPLLSLPRLGGLNVHPSLLPRHRGPDPLFWTYLHGEREAGITVHRLTARADAGAILAQERVSVGHGQPLGEVYLDLSARGARLLAECVQRLADGSVSETAQDESQATNEPSPARDTWRRQPIERSTELMWHFLSGLGGQRTALLTDLGGEPVAHGAAIAHRLEKPSREPGAIERRADRLRLHCTDGFVELALPSFAAQARVALERIRRRVTSGGFGAHRR